MASPLLSERVSALEARVDRLEALLIAFRDETRQRFDAIDARFVAIDARFVAIDARFVAINERFVAIDERFDAIDQRLDETNRRIGVLHEDVIARIAMIGEQLNGRRRKRRKSTSSE